MIVQIRRSGRSYFIALGGVAVLALVSTCKRSIQCQGFVLGSTQSRHHFSSIFANDGAPFSSEYRGNQTCSTNVQQESQTAIVEPYRLLLLSLQYPPDNDPLTFSKITKDIWKWKDAVLGDGRDYFVPKPKTLTALNKYIVDQCSVQECVVLSNCARFDMLIRDASDENDHESSIISVCQSIVAQVKAYNKRVAKSPSIMHKLLPSGDWSDTIIAKVDVNNENDDASQLRRHLTVFNSTESIMRYLGKVAAGMATRPKRPDRPVPFQPFSSRDAHILLQLKRTTETIVVTQNEKILLLILQKAIQIGKAARDESIVPELKQLRQGGTGDTKYDIMPSLELSQQVAHIVIDTVMEPAVDAVLSDLASMSVAKQIADFRKQALSVAENELEMQYIQKALHQPTMLLRKGQTSTNELESQLQCIINSIHERRKTGDYTH